MKKTPYKKANLFWYNFTKFVSFFLNRFVFKVKRIRNEIRGKKTPYVILCNHECALDFPLIINSTSRRLSFVVSKSFYDSLPIHNIMKKLGLIVKQQFQTTQIDIKKMKRSIDANVPLVLFPSGLMTENGLSTPIPDATYKLLKFLDADVYVGRIKGTYFVNAKWRKGFRNGKTYLDIYKLFSKEELKTISNEAIKQKIDEALIFDAYNEQEQLLIKYKNNQDICGLENVLYMCPCCKGENMKIKDTKTIYCNDCGFEQTTDEYGFLHQNNINHQEIRHVSDWDILIYEQLRKNIKNNINYELSSNVELHMIDEEKHKFVKVGDGILSLNKDVYRYVGKIANEDVIIENSSKPFYILPNNPIKNSIEFQDKMSIYRFILKSEKQFVVKWLHALKIFYEINNGINVKVYSKGEKYE